MGARQAEVRRQTGETSVTVRVVVDGQGRCAVSTAIGFFDHMIQQLAKHGRFDIEIEAQGDLGVDGHHTMEDVAIALGRAFDEALGDRRGIVRMGHAIVPLDEALALVAIDISGRGYASVSVEFAGARVGDVDSDMVRHFLESFAAEARMTVHAVTLRGTNDHHKAEALFKAFARALDQATALDPRLNDVPSTKGVIEGGAGQSG